MPSEQNPGPSEASCENVAVPLGLPPGQEPSDNGFRPDQPSDQSSVVPWEDTRIRNIFRRYWLTMAQTLTSPVSFFDKVGNRADESIVPPMFFGLVTAVLQLLVSSAQDRLFG